MRQISSIRSTSLWPKGQQSVADVGHPHPVVPGSVSCPEADAIGTASIRQPAPWPTDIRSSISYSTLCGCETVEEVLVIVVIEVVIEKVDPHLEKGCRGQEGVGARLMLRSDSLYLDRSDRFSMIKNNASIAFRRPHSRSSCLQSPAIRPSNFLHSA